MSAELERALQEARGEREDVRARHTSAAGAMSDLSGDPVGFARARSQRDRLASEVERLELRVTGLEDQRSRAEHAGKLERLAKHGEQNARAVREFEFAQRKPSPALESSPPV
jgi:hypothetical protein